MQPRGKQGLAVETPDADVALTVVPRVIVQSSHVCAFFLTVIPFPSFILVFFARLAAMKHELCALCRRLPWCRVRWERGGADGRAL
eukprot:6288175-Prymnesium_polylepis.1